MTAQQDLVNKWMVAPSCAVNCANLLKAKVAIVSTQAVNVLKHQPFYTLLPVVACFHTSFGQSTISNWCRRSYHSVCVDVMGLCFLLVRLQVEPDQSAIGEASSVLPKPLGVLFG